MVRNVLDARVQVYSLKNILKRGNASQVLKKESRLEEA